MVVNVGTHDQGSVTQGDELALCNINNVSTHAPTYYNASFILFHSLFQEAISNISDIRQNDSFFHALSSADCSFKFRKITNGTADVTGYIWQKGVMRRDFELYSSTLFLDRMGRPLNNKGWPLLTMAMLSGDKKVCLASEAIVISECVGACACMIQSK
jgi:hypothetical protein